jgi:hypothetical protein
MISVRLISSSTSLICTFAGDRHEQKVGERCALEGREQRNRHERDEFRRVGHVSEYLHHSDECVPIIPKAGAQSPMAR